MKSSSGLSSLEVFVNDTCHIPFQFFICKESKQLSWRDLMGPEKLVVFRKINLCILFPELPNVTAIQALWDGFMSLHKVLQCEKISSSEADHFQADAQKWVADFTSVYQTKHVTPYIHIMATHVPYFIKKYGNLVQFTQQGMEKLNDETSIDFARSTNHRHENLDALKQMMAKKNRIEYLQDNGFERDRRAVMCSVCHQQGHNRLSCTSKKLNNYCDVHAF